MKIFFMYTVPQSNSIYKKVRDQISTFEKLKSENVIDDFSFVSSSISEDLIYTISINNKEVKFNEKPGHVNVLKNVVLSYPRLYKNVYNFLIENNYSHIFIRRAVCDVFLISFMKKLKKAGVKIIFEIPTYPYDKEFPPNSIYKRIDNKWRKHLKLYVDYIVTPYRGYDEIFGVPVIYVDNGIIVDNVKRIEHNHEVGDTSINLIAVAGLSYWHGYDRLLRGLIEYYDKSESPRDVFFHMVGGEKDNPFRKEYEHIVEGSSIKSRVKFYGSVFGDDLNGIYDLADIAISSLGLHRIGLKQSATLKSREYIAKGLPVVTEGTVGNESEGFKYEFNVPMDESPVKIEELIEFYDNVLNENTRSRESIINEIVEYAYKNFDMYELMKKMVSEMQ